MSAERLQRKLERAQRKVALLEQLIEDKSRELFYAQEKARESARFLGNVLETLSSAVVVVGPKGEIRSANRSACRLSGQSEQELVGQPLAGRIATIDGAAEDACRLAVEHLEVEWVHADGERTPILFAGSLMHDSGGALEGVVCVALDLTEKKRLEVQLRHAQKLESVGQLASGIAHEINTPVQFIGDSISFLRDAFSDYHDVLDVYASMRSGASPEMLARIAEVEEEADLEFLEAEVPGAFERAADGVRRVSEIVRAMKEFAHPGGVEKAASDINDAIETTLAVARNEYKYVADLELELGEIPAVVCHVGDVNQVVLNLVINAAHAIESRVGASGERGTITIRTRFESDAVVIEVADTGDGIPDKIAARVFDPFFTTKAVGKGSGQGLAIVHAVVVDKHGGQVAFDTEEGHGTTFFVRLPVAAPEVKDAA